MMFRKILIAASLIILGLAAPAGAQVGEPVLLVANKNVPASGIGGVMDRV